MDFIGAMSEMAETSEINGDSTFEFSEKANDKFDKIMGDDKIDSSQYEDAPQLTPEERENKFSKLFDVGDFFRKAQFEQMDNIYHFLKPCGDGVLTLEEMPILSGFVAYFEGNISTKIGLKICACIEKLNTGVVKIDLLA